jgi:hypothetical protein
MSDTSDLGRQRQMQKTIWRLQVITSYNKSIYIRAYFVNYGVTGSSDGNSRR